MPLRVRLTLWYGTALALILLTFSVVLYTITARGLRDQVDESLEETASAAVRSLETRGFLPLIDEEALHEGLDELAEEAHAQPHVGRLRWPEHDAFQHHSTDG